MNVDLGDSELPAALARLLSPSSGPVVLDVGANEGQFTAVLLEAVDAEVFCIEPIDAAFKALDDRFRSDSRVQTFQYAVDAIPGTRKMVVTESSVGSSLLPPIEGQASKWAQVSHEQEVSVIRLEDLLDLIGQEFIHLLKVDTQGTDERVLQSAGDRLSPAYFGAVLVEMNFHQVYEGQGGLGSLIELLEDAGYFFAECFRHYNRQGWLWYADGLFLPRDERYAT